MTHDSQLDVWIGEQLAGHLRTKDGRQLEFGYDTAYREDAGSTALSLSLPLARRAHRPEIVSNYFEALLPEQGFAREQLALEAGVSRANIFGLLAHVGRDLPGAVCVVEAGEGLPTSGSVTRLSESDLASYIAELRQAAATGALPLSEHGQWSLAGAQAKVALSYVDGQWGIPHGATPTTHIVKPAIPGFEDFDAYEVICLRAARRLGLSVADAWLQPLSDGTHAAVVRRYDRVPTADGTVRRIHQEDMGQALGYPAWQKYERDGGPSVSAVGALLARLPVRFRETSAIRLLEALAFNLAIAGTDGHARNFSLLISGADAVLAPLYDLNSALPYTRPWGRRFDSVRKLHSSFVLGTTDAFTRVTPEDWRTTAESLGISGDLAFDRMYSIISGVSDALEESAAEVRHESGLAVNFDWAGALGEYHESLGLVTRRRAVDAIRSAPVMDVPGPRGLRDEIEDERRFDS